MLVQTLAITRFLQTLKIKRIMKQVIILLTLAAFILSQNTLYAQNKDDHRERWEKYQAEKVAFLTNKLDLTPKQAEKFWPVYIELEKKSNEAQKQKREVEKQVLEASEKLSDQEIIKLTREFAGTMEKECHWGTEYNEKFLEILPPLKVLVLYKAEGEFRMYMFRKFREHRDNK